MPHILRGQKMLCYLMPFGLNSKMTPGTESVNVKVSLTKSSQKGGLASSKMYFKLATEETIYFLYIYKDIVLSYFYLLCHEF